MPRLAQEALPERLVLGEVRRKELQRDHAVEDELVREVDDAHPAAAEHPLDAVAEQLGCPVRRSVGALTCPLRR